jgi:hypothetical protein
MAFWYSLWSFVIFFPFWYVWAKKNLAALVGTRSLDRRAPLPVKEVSNWTHKKIEQRQISGNNFSAVTSPASLAGKDKPVATLQPVVSTAAFRVSFIALVNSAN